MHALLLLVLGPLPLQPLFCGAHAGAPVSPAPPALSAPVRWSGSVQVGPHSLSVLLTVRAPDAATLSIPQQGLTDGTLKDVQVTTRRMRFRLHLPPMPEDNAAVFDLAVDDAAGTASGTMKQGAATLPVTLKRAGIGDAPGLSRPQTPAPPFPYTSIDVRFDNPQTKAALAGTLTLPAPGFAKAGRHGAVVLISGSGGQDRDGTVFDHKPFWVLADALSRAGVAVLRVDDPGVGQSENPYGPNGREGTTQRYVQDVLAAVRALKARDDIDPARIGLIGHSEGGVIAPMAAAQSTDVAFIVMLAGTGVKGSEVLIRQQEAINRAAGLPAPEQQRASALQRRVMELVASDKPDDELRAELARVAEQASAGDSSIDDEQRKALTGPALLQPWVRAFVRLDPQEALRQVRVPVLVLQGALDVQVVADQNVPAIAGALMQAGNTDVTIRVLPGLNHLFQPARTGLVSEYGVIETTIAPEVLRELTTWVPSRAGVTQVSR